MRIAAFLKKKRRAEPGLLSIKRQAAERNPAAVAVKLRTVNRAEREARRAGGTEAVQVWLLNYVVVVL
jgi:hypothetical protein